MAIHPTPDPVVCANRPRHDYPGRKRLPPASAFLRSHRGEDDVLGWTPRCDICIRELAAKPATVVLVDVYDLGPARVGTHHDHDDDPVPT